MLIVFLIVAGFTFVVAAYMQLPKFGKLPSGVRLQQIKNSPNYRDGKFQNLSHTPDLTEGVTYATVMRGFLFGKNKDIAPSITLPSKKTNLHNLNPDKNVLVWFGHSSYFIRIDGKRFLVDPVFSGNASPIPGSMKSFKGSDVYTTDDIPNIDYLFISHDHWDHLDYETIKKLQPKIGKVITGLGTGLHLERWGYKAENIIEKDWHSEIVLEAGFVVNTLPARHFSGRGIKRQQALWMSFALKTPGMNIFVGGDSGYDMHFAEIGRKHGPFDLAVLECGQYNVNWKYIHSMPEEVVKAAQDLKAKKLLPVHWAKFALSQHAWNEPIKRVTAEAKRLNMPIATPMIGEELNLKEDRSFTEWWN